MRSFVKIFFVVLMVLLLTTTHSSAAKKKDEKEKDCIYCKKYEKLKDWPESERPEAFTYEEIKYPEKMFHKNDKTRFLFLTIPKRT